MTRFLLPELGESADIKVNGYGQWVSDNQNELSILTDDLENMAAGKANVTAIPDFWAHPKLLELILKNENHPLYSKYLGQWRGIMALLALRELRSLTQLGIKSIDIPEAIEGHGNGNLLFKVVTKMYDWKLKKFADSNVSEGCSYRIQLITFNDKPLALLWPSLMLCPAITLEHGMDVRPVEWWQGDQIVDPCSYLGKDERKSLCKWLEDLTHDISQKETDYIQETGDHNGLNDNASNLVGLLNKFIKDLKAGFVEEEFKNITISKGTNDQLTITGYYRALGFPIGYTEDGNFLNNSNVLIRSRDGKKYILAVSKDVGERWGVANSDVIVAGNISLAMISADLNRGAIPNKAKLINVDLNEYSAQLWSANNFFTKKILLVSSEDETLFPTQYARKTAIISYNGMRVNVIMPIREEVLNYFTPDYLAANTVVAVDGEDIIVDLALTVSGKQVGNRKEQVIHVSRRFSKEAGEINNEVNESEPLIEIWPNFITQPASKWQAYFSFYDRQSQPTSLSFYARPSSTCWNYKDNSVISREITVNNNKIEVLRGRTFPEAYTCYSYPSYSDSEGNSWITEDLELGLICIKIPEEKIIEKIDSCRIGIDFGTTNTVAYISTDSLDGDDDDNTKVLELQNRIFNVTRVRRDSRAELRRYFIPASVQPDTHDLPSNISIRTIFNDYTGKFSGVTDRPLVRGNIYYLEGARSIGDDTVIKETIHDDMKWEQGSSNPETVNRIKGFLEQLTMQCLAEAVYMGIKNVQWLYSYPKAYDEDQIDVLQSIWNSTVIPCLNDISNVIYNNNVSGTSLANAESRTESKSMSDFFVKKQKAAIGVRGMVCFDIGGGSTDIAVWHGQTATEPIHQCSFKFAGRDILSRYLFNKQRKNPNLLKALSSAEPVFENQLKRVCSKKNFKEFNLELEAMLKYHENSIFRSLGASSQDKDLYIVLRDVTFALCGIFFYTGMVLGYQLKHGHFKNMRNLPNCYVGGNASKLLNWAAKGEYNDSRLNTVFLNCFWFGIVAFDKEYAASLREQGFNVSGNIHSSTHPKEEVAYGLVSRESHKVEGDIVLDPFGDDIFGEEETSSGPSNDDYAVAGETFFVGNKEFSGDALERGYFTNPAETVEADWNCSNFKKFVIMFNKLVGGDKYKIYRNVPVKLDDKYDSIAERVNEILESVHNKGINDPTGVDLEPIFILELKAALDCLSEK